MKLHVFPTPVGMNRIDQLPGGRRDGVPHTRGDEPFLRVIPGGCPAVFPTPVGMNLPQAEVTVDWFRVPHTRGDEPAGNGLLTKLLSVFPTPVGMNRLVGIGAW